MQRRDPQPAAAERTTIEQFLDYQRATLLQKTEGLDASQMNRRLPTSALTLSGLLKHLALVEDDWIQVRFLGLPELEPWASAPWDEDRDWGFTLPSMTIRTTCGLCTGPLVTAAVAP